ncbi:serine arginine repetitive matrix protein 1-like protein [Lasius niger]|uniref:Serine arginine repetitive matrix protein 1-like protein n=1 Tax=Lasius niger TaxID=67767 RepID=A0A0J7MS82_LASNI|nr:serine arginine repetitive matrix protein 1-like protein [Lasius niger]
MTARSVLRELAEQLEAAAEMDPQFWVGLREEIGRARMTQGARHQRATQTSGPLLDVAVQVAPTTTERATQTDRETGSSSDSSSSVGDLEGLGMEPRYLFPPEGCWNCRGNDHRYSECPRPRRIQFCYRCGQFGKTVKDCPICKEAWRAQGPYRPGRGHDGPEPPRRTGPPPARGRAARPAR